MLSLTLVVRLYDAVGVPPREIVAARHAAAAALAGAAIDVAWVACAPPARHVACGDKPRPTDVLVRIVPRSPAPASRSLADAYVNAADASGALATVYLERVRALAAVAGVDPGTLMGRAIAHEIGHLLLGTATHSRGGLMRAVWSAAQLRRDHPGVWSFSRPEAARLRARLEARYEAERIEQFAGLVEPLPPTKPGCPGAALTCVQRR